MLKKNTNRAIFLEEVLLAVIEQTLADAAHRVGHSGHVIDLIDLRSWAKDG